MANKMALRQINRNSIFRCIYTRDAISRQDIASETGLSMPTVIQNLNDLSERGLIQTKGAFQSTGGRRPMMIACVYDAAFAVGIDITQNHLTIALVNLKGEIRCGGNREHFPYLVTDEYYDSVCGKLEQMIEENGIDRERIIGVGISLPSIVDETRCRVIYGRILNEPSDVISCFSERMPYRIRLFNDANAAGYAETWADKSESTCFYLMLSNSVGGAMIENRKIYLGDNFRSSEIGHVKIVPGGRECYCGQKGCANAYLSARILSEGYDGGLDDFFSDLEKGDAVCRETFDTYLDFLAVTVVNIRMLYDCRIILGGYVGKYMDSHMEELGKQLLNYNPYDTDSEYVSACKYKNDASAVGAALPLIAEYIENI